MLTDTAAGMDVATHDRRVELLLQDLLLLLHVTVAANAVFEPHSRHKVFGMF